MGASPRAALEPIGQGSHRLYAPAAQAWKACVEAARADGIDLTITDSYRTFDQQVDLAQRKGLYSNGGYRRDARDIEPWLGPGRRRRRDLPADPRLDARQRVEVRLRRGRAARAVALGVPPTTGVARVTSGGFTATSVPPAEVPSTISLAQIGQVPRIGTNTIPTHGGRESCVSTRT